MNLTGIKATVLVLIGIIKLLCGLAPIVFTKILKRKSERFLKKFIGKKKIPIFDIDIFITDLLLQE